MNIFIYDNGYDLHNYINFVKQTGNKPVLSKNSSDIANCGGLILTGGGDITPTLFGERKIPSVPYDFNTDIKEFFLLNHAVLHNLPVLGICKGLQVINVYFGGKVDYLNDYSNHYQKNTDILHPLKFSNGKEITVNSCHKQFITNIPKCLTPFLFSYDNIIEGAYHNTLPILGVQFHPERLNDSNITELFRNHFAPNGRFFNEFGV